MNSTYWLYYIRENILAHTDMKNGRYHYVKLQWQSLIYLNTVKHFPILILL